jgi:hypothetical protein
MIGSAPNVKSKLQTMFSSKYEREHLVFIFESCFLFYLFIVEFLFNLMLACNFS